MDGKSEAGATSAVAETIAAGYTFQGKLVRAALVRLQTNGADTTSKPQPVETSEGEGQSQLPLETADAGPG